MARKPNYQFERMERERQKASKVAGKADAKRAQREAARAAADPDDVTEDLPKDID